MRGDAGGQSGVGRAWMRGVAATATRGTPYEFPDGNMYGVPGFYGFYASPARHTTKP